MGVKGQGHIVDPPLYPCSISIGPSIPEIWPDIQSRPEHDVVSHKTKIQILELNIQHSSWSWLIRCVNMKWMQLVLWKIQSKYDLVYRQTDGQKSPSVLHRTSSQRKTSITPTELHWWGIWVRSRNCVCLVTWFCYQLIAKPGNKTATVPWPDPYNYQGPLLSSDFSSHLSTHLSWGCTVMASSEHKNKWLLINTEFN